MDDREIRNSWIMGDPEKSLAYVTDYMNLVRSHPEYFSKDDDGYDYYKQMCEGRREQCRFYSDSSEEEKYTRKRNLSNS